MIITHKHASHKRGIVLAVVAVLAISASGLAEPQLTNAVSAPSNTGAFGRSSITNFPGSKTNTTGTTSTSPKTGSASTSTTTPVSSSTAPSTTTTPSSSKPISTVSGQTTPTTTSTNTATTTTTAPAPAATSAAPTSTAVTKTESVTPVVKAPVNTSAQVALTAKAQTIGPSTTIVYHSNKISPETATLIYRTAGVTFLIAVALLASTKIVSPVPMNRRVALTTN